MPVTMSGKVLVSGANGFVAVVSDFCFPGFSVRGAVRSATKGTHLVEQFAAYGDKFELAIVPDITKEGAFDQAVKNVDAIAHSASPYHFHADDPGEWLEPAIKGTISILESARRFGTAVKRVVVTSSTAAVQYDSPNPRVFSELDWDDPAVEEVEKKGRAASNVNKYRASKTLAERAAWDFVKTHQSTLKWDLAVLNPPLVLGPILHAVSSPAELNTSARQMYEAFTKLGAAGTGGRCWVDVRDIALAHVRALQKQAAGGERIIVAAGAFKWQDWRSMLRVLIIDYETPGPPGALRHSKSIRILGTQYRSMAKTAAAVLDDYERRGW
ncbi:NAD(P)-binding protein [Mycena olivaceomarginata]|nr:NAD(P)-binding protein [Mycena olivaceomarginata]